MRRRRMVLIAAAIIVVAGGLAQALVNSQTVNLVVVNASGKPVDIAWQPSFGAATVSAPKGGCESTSMQLARGESWTVSRDGVPVLDASTAGLPLVAPMVAVEVWLDPDGSVRIVPPHEIARPVDSPIPNCQSASS